MSASESRARASTTVSAWSAEVCDKILSLHAGQGGALLPILHEVQAAFGYVPDPAVGIIADRLNLTRAEVHGVLSFYHDFRKSPAGRRLVKLCQAEACQARGGRAVTAAAQARLGVSLGETSADGAVTLEPIYCLGLCASGPAALVDGRPVGRLTVEDLAPLMGEA